MTQRLEQDKPLLVAVEGPAGAGKTSLAQALTGKLLESGLHAVHLSEFSETPLGVQLTCGSRFGSERRAELLGLAGVMAYLSDKIYQFSRATGSRIAVSERHVLTQLVLGLQSIPTQAGRENALDAINAADDWAREEFAAESLLVHLTCSSSILVDRMKRRLRRPLSFEECEQLEYEVLEYSRLFSGPLPWRTVELAATRSPGDLVSEIYDLLQSSLVLG